MLNPKVTKEGIHYLNNQLMWWSSRGPIVGLDFVPKFKGLGSLALVEPTEENIRGHEFLNWFEDVFEECRLEYRPEAPSRIGAIMVCPKLGQGFCSKRSGREAAWGGHTHVYEVAVTGKAFTTDAEMLTEARINATRALGGPYLNQWGDPRAREYALAAINSYARSYWTAGLRTSLHEDDDEDEERYFYSSSYLETLVEGEARIIGLAEF